MTSRHHPWSAVVGSLLLAGLVALACSDPTAPRLEDCPGDTVTLSSSAGLTPTFNWAPGCGMAWIVVEVFGSDQSVWTLASGRWGPTRFDFNNRLASGIRYGGVRTGTVTIVPPTPLDRGVDYEVRVYRVLLPDTFGLGMAVLAGKTRIIP